MRHLTTLKIRGNWATLITPWNDDDSPDIHRLAAEIDAMIGFGVDGIDSNGTAGEFHTQSEQEFDLISGILANAESIDDLAAHRVTDILTRGGGAIIAPCHVVQVDVSTANLEAMCDAVRQHEA
jgi:hypothetical protein